MKDILKISRQPRGQLTLQETETSVQLPFGNQSEAASPAPAGTAILSDSVRTPKPEPPKISCIQLLSSTYSVEEETSAVLSC